MEAENMAEPILDGFEVLCGPERRVKTVVGILVSEMCALKPKAWEFGFSIDCPGKKLAWVFPPRGGQEDVKLCARSADGHFGEVIYAPGIDIATKNAKAVCEALDYFILGMLRKFPELG